MRRISVLMVLRENDRQSAGRIAVFQHGLKSWVDGWPQSLIDYRWGISDPEQARAAPLNY